MALHPHIRAIIDAQAAAGMPAFASHQPAEMRAVLAAMQANAPPRPTAKVGPVEDIMVGAPGNAVAVRRYLPDGAAPVGRIVYFHGGGWVVGTVDSCDPLCRALVAASQCELVSVDYRLAPEAPFPAAIEDGWTVLQDAASTELPMFVAGDSAGGNIAAALALRVRDEGGPALAGQILLYPVTDHDLDRPSYREHGDAGLILTRADMAWFWSHYIADPADRSAPLASPLRAGNHQGLPAAFVAVAGFDPLHDEGVAYAQALDAARVPVALREDADMVHGYCSFVGIVDVADDAVKAAGSWARDRALDRTTVHASRS